MRTMLCDRLGIEVPIVQAPMGGAAGAKLAAAVCNAGGLGTLPLWTLDADGLKAEIAALRALTDRPFAANLNLRFPQAERLDLCLAARAPVVSFFWGDQGPLVGRAKDAGAIVLQTVGSAEHARRAVDGGADVVVAQGWESGGHVWGRVATMALVPAVVDAVGATPVIAAGGIADGRGMAAALALGAAGVWIGTRFLASSEAEIHPHYLARVLGASEDDTVHLDDLFDVGWPDAPHRLLRNAAVNDWEAAGRPPSGSRPGQGAVVARSAAGEVLRYTATLPTPDFEGDLDDLSMWAGQGVAQARAVRPAGEIVREIAGDAAAILRRLGGGDG